MESAFKKLDINAVDFLLMHPPYMDIVKFTDKEYDLSCIDNVDDFIDKFKIVCSNYLPFLKKTDILQLL